MLNVLIHQMYQQNPVLLPLIFLLIHVLCKMILNYTKQFITNSLYKQTKENAAVYTCTYAIF